jgi:DNA-binding transcriptional LysR family regulator
LTLEQLTIFLAVAEAQHVTRAAETLGLTPSAVSASIKALERFYNVALFSRVGRGIELTEAGRLFVDEARATLARAQAAALALSDLGGLKRGVLRLSASQTTASHWLPPRLMRFRTLYPGVEVDLTVGNTSTVARDVLTGASEIGLIEGEIDEPALASTRVARDELVILCAPSHPLASAKAAEVDGLLRDTGWVMREQGSGTRAALQTALSRRAIDPNAIRIALVLPSNEAVISALIDSDCASCLSRAAAAPYLALGRLSVAPVSLAARDFTFLRHKERGLSPAGREFGKLCD